MKTFRTFSFESWSFDQRSLTANFVYAFDNEVFFSEKICFDSPKFSAIPSLDPLIMDNLLFHLSLAIGISYYKLCPTAELHIKNGYLNDQQKAFRKSFYINGLGEYFFTNKISPVGLVEFINTKPETSFPFLNAHFSCHHQQAMVAIG